MSLHKFRVPRIWSNRELEKFAALFKGKVVNISGWRDFDKNGKTYKEYFSSANEYWITNYKSEARGFQGDQENEFFLDLTAPLGNNYPAFDVVFNHTVLEHIFEVDVAFRNLCALSRDVVVLIVPFLQEQHGDYGDYWRFSPQAVDMLFTKNKMEVLYLNYNDSANSSIYVFAIASKFPENWKQIKAHSDNKLIKIYTNEGLIGTKIIKPNLSNRFLNKCKDILVKLTN